MKTVRPSHATLLHTSMLVCFVHSLLSMGLLADSWPQFQGADRDNKSSETGLLATWPEAGPALAWSFKNAGVGYSSPTVVDGRIYLTGGRDGKTELFCLDSADGKELWSLPLNSKSFDFEANAWGAGPRSAVTVDGDFLYALTGDGQLVCATSAGKAQWQLNMIADLGGSIKNVRGGEPETIGWGYSWAPLVDGEHLICTPGSANGEGLVVALNKETGKVVWRSKELDEEATYASPIIATIDGVKQYVVMTQRGVASVDTNGKLLWYYKRSRPYSNFVIPTPICQGNQHR